MTIFLTAQALVWFPYGLWCLVHPETLATFAGVVATTPTAISEVRAMYGGLQAGIGVLAALAVARAERHRSAVATLGVLAGSLGIGRSIGALVGADLSAYTLGAIGFELGSALWAGLLLRR